MVRMHFIPFIFFLCLDLTKCFHFKFLIIFFFHPVLFLSYKIVWVKTITVKWFNVVTLICKSQWLPPMFHLLCLHFILNDFDFLFCSGIAVKIVTQHGLTDIRWWIYYKTVHIANIENQSRKWRYPIWSFPNWGFMRSKLR